MTVSLLVGTYMYILYSIVYMYNTDNSGYIIGNC